MKTIYLIRHGDVENPEAIFYPATFPLSARGVHGARALGALMREAELQPKHLIASPHVRTRETAEIIAQAIDGMVETDERLVEWKVNDWIGKPLADYRHAAGYDDPPPFRLKLADVESFESMSARVITVVRDALARLAEGEMSMLVGHREPMVASILALRGETDWHNIPLLDMPKPCAWKLTFENGALVAASKAFDTSDVN